MFENINYIKYLNYNNPLDNSVKNHPVLQFFRALKALLAKCMFESVLLRNTTTTECFKKN